MTNCLFDIRGNGGWRRGCCWLFYNGARVTNHEKLIRLLDNGRSRNTCPSIRPPGTATLTGLGRQAGRQPSIDRSVHYTVSVFSRLQQRTAKAAHTFTFSATSIRYLISSRYTPTMAVIISLRSCGSTRSSSVVCRSSGRGFVSCSDV